MPARARVSARRRFSLIILVALALGHRPLADGASQALPFSQDWTNVALITTDNDWSGVPGVIGYLGDYTSAAPTGVDPRTLLGDLGTTAVDVIANQTNPNLTTGGVAEFHLVNPTIALQGSGTADAPFILINVDATGVNGLTVSYNLRDIDGSLDSAAQQVALHYRVGSSGPFTNVPEGYVADATTGPSQAWLETPVCVVLPPAADGQSLVQVRIMTTNAPANDEWVGVDDISVAAGGSCDSVSPRAFGHAAPEGLLRGASTLLTVIVAPGRYPDSTGLQVTADLSAIGGSAAQMFFDNGTNGDPVANDRIFSFRTTIPMGTPSGRLSFPATVTDAQLRTTSTTIPIAVAFELPIHAIQGNAARSPYAGEFVLTEGIVTARSATRFFIQMPDADNGRLLGAPDGLQETSDGVAVFRAGAPAPGTLVQVTGTVNEFVSEAGGSPVTELGGTVTIIPVLPLVPLHPLPASIDLTPTDLDPAGPPDQLERLEGMRVRTPSLTVVAPTLGNVSEPNASATSNGVFYAVLTGAERPFREPGIGATEPLPPGAPPNVPTFDENPERLRVDSDALTGARLMDLASGEVVNNLIGVLDYGFRTYTILPDPPPPGPPAPAVLRRCGDAPVLAPAPPVLTDCPAVPLPASASDQFTIASFNVQRLFDTIDDPAVDDVVMNVTGDPFGRRLTKLSLTIRNILQSPDVIGFQEVENLATLEALAIRVNDLAGTPGDYVAYLQEGNDIGGIDVGFLVKSSRVQVVEVTQEGAHATFVNPITGQPETLNDRPPLVLRATIASAAGGRVPVTVIVNHLRSLTGINDPADGVRVRAKRHAQAEFLANLIQERQSADPHERIISLGDYNAFEFNDGLVDMMGTVKGTPAPADQVVLAGNDLVDPDLTDLVETLAAGERYSYVFDGNAQAIDHALVTASLGALVDDVRFARVNADYPEVLRGILSLPQPAPAAPRDVPERASDHDPLVVYFHFPAPTLTTLASSGSPSGFGRDVTFTATVTSGGQAVTEGEVLFSADGAALGTVPLDGQGRATLTTASLTLGTHSVAADYSGAATLDTSREAIEQIVQPTLSVDDVFFTEGDAGLTPAVFTLTLNPAPEDKVTVRVATVDGTAAAGTDYTVIESLKVTFPAGTALQQVVVPLVGETVFETDETFEVQLDDARGAVVVDGTGVGSILNDDSPPTIGILDASAPEPESGATSPMRFSVRLSNPSAFPVRVRFFTHDGSARRGEDYKAAAGSVSFAPFETERAIDVTILADNKREKSQSFWVVLWDAEGGSIGDRVAIGTILDTRPERKR